MRSLLQKIILVPAVLLSLSTCKNIDQVKPADRNTFIRYYGDVGNFEATAAEAVSDGYIIVGDSVSSTSYNIVVIKTDKFGNTVWRKIYKNGASNSIKVLTDGYLILGDSIQVNPGSQQVSDLIKRKMRLMKIDANGTIIQDKSWGDINPNDTRVDYSGNALVVPSVDTIIYTINSIKYQGLPAKSFVAAHKTTDFSMVWSKTYELDNWDFINAKSAYLTSTNQVLWAASGTQTQSSSSKSYLTVPVIKQQQSFENGDSFGLTEDNVFYSGNDIQQSAIGYGIIGTYKSYTGANSNIFFIRTTTTGSFISGSDLYFDGITSADNTSLKDKNSSQTQDEGTALAVTSDGGYLLAGTTTTTTTRGNGGLDIFLIKLDPFGNVLWNKTMGGSGDETVTSIRQLSDGFLICGTPNLSGLESIFLIKTDQNGDLTN